MILKTIYVGNQFGEYHDWVEENCDRRSQHRGQAWWFPEIDYGEACGFVVARHPVELIKMMPEILRSRHRKVVTMSEHLILAIQQLVRQSELGCNQIELYCGQCEVLMDVDGDLLNWPGDFFPERLELLR